MLRNTTGIDHVGLDPRDIWQAFASFSRLGFVVSTPSRFQTVPVESCQVLFPERFLSLSTTYSRGSDPQTEWVTQTKPVGTTELMLGTRDVQALKAELARDFPHLLRGSAQAQVERRIHLGGIRYQIFRILVLAPGTVEGLDVLGFCEHATPELVWRSELLAHPNGADGMRSLTFVHADPPSLQTLYSKLFAASSVGSTPDVLEFDLGGVTLRFVTAARFARLAAHFPAWPARAKAGLRMIEFRVADLDRTRDHFDFMGIAYASDNSGQLHVDPEFSGDWLFSFTSHT